MTDLDDIFDDLFHGCAWQAYLEQVAIEGGPPDCEATRQGAYELYEAALAERPANRVPAQARDSL